MAGIGMQLDRGQGLGRVEIVEVLRHDEGEMRSHETDIEAPRCRVLRMGFDPLPGPRHDGSIVLGCLTTDRLGITNEGEEQKES